MQITDTIAHRGLILGAERKRYVLCVLYGKNRASTLVRLSNEWKLECAMVSMLQMKNLVVCRGGKSEETMIGPCNFFGTLENIKNKSFSITIDTNDVLCFLKHDLDDVYLLNVNNSFNQKLTSLKGLWQSHCLPNSRHSLFPTPGLLTFDTTLTCISLQQVQNIDSKFKARLVANNKPFMFINDSQKHKNEDDLRVVSYKFGSRYADYQVAKGEGLFLERHEFMQSITPLNLKARGFVTLAHESSNDEYQLIAVVIPFGFTLIIEEDCIHGDSNLIGHYAMCMTSNHNSMRTADTVFLKNKQKQNLALTIEQSKEQEDEYYNDHFSNIYNYNQNNYLNCVVNPFSFGYWKYIFS